MKIWRCLVLSALALAGCREELRVGPEPSPYPGSVLLINSSFELGGAPSFSGWQRENEASISFWSNTPPGGESWSALIQPLWGTPASLTALVPASQGIRIYRLSIWARRSGPAGTAAIVVKHGDSTTPGNTFAIEDTAWTPFLLYDTLSITSGDSIGVRLSGGLSQTQTGFTAFDLCVFEMLE